MVDLLKPERKRRDIFGKEMEGMVATIQKAGYEINTCHINNVTVEWTIDRFTSHSSEQPIRLLVDYSRIR